MHLQGFVTPVKLGVSLFDEGRPEFIRGLAPHKHELAVSENRAGFQGKGANRAVRNFILGMFKLLSHRVGRKSSITTSIHSPYCQN